MGVDDADGRAVDSNTPAYNACLRAAFPEGKAGQPSADDYSSCFRYNGEDKEGTPTFTFVTCHAPPRAELQALLVSIINLMHDVVQDKDYTLIYYHTRADDDPSRHVAFGFLRSTYRMLPRCYKKNLRNLYVVHPSMSLRLTLMAMSPFLSDKVWSKVHYVHRLSDLYLDVPAALVAPPPEAVKHDADQENEPFMGVCVDVEEPQPLPPGGGTL